MKTILVGCVIFLSVGFTICAPNLVLTTDPPKTHNETKEGTEKPPDLIIYEFGVKSNISNRYSTTVITSRVKNPDANSKEAVFSVVLPEKAYISEFVMEIKGKKYKAYVKEKEEAKNIYDKAVQSGQSAGYVAVSARDSNRFTVSVNVEAETKAVFYLTYEELLERKNNKYELVLNIHPGQIVKDLHVEVIVNETRPLKFVKTPSLRSGNEISKNDETLDPGSVVNIINSTSAIVTFKPDIEQQKNFIKTLGGKENEGLTGQFVVQYDVERDPSGGEVLLHDGYFVHFFAPENIKPLTEHIVFILDTSGSMYGTKLKQLKDAMASILSQLKEDDTFHIIEFNTYVYVWDINNKEKIKVNITDDDKPFEDVVKAVLPPAIQATKENIVKGKEVIEKLQDEGITNMLSSLITGLHLAKSTYKNESEKTHHQPIVIFLTDGDPTAGIINTDEITNITTDYNSGDIKVPLFSLSFGDEADKYFLRKLSLNNLGFSRHIYEAADASLQLQEFYNEISSPLLANVHFKYDSEVKAVSRKDFPIFFRGSELVTVGKYEGTFSGTVEGSGINGTISVPTKVETPVSSLERLWAYLTVKQKLEDRETVANKTQLTKDALDLALKYSFVTDVSSLVVVKPNDTSSVNTVDASNSGGDTSRASVVGLRFTYDDMDYDDGGYMGSFESFSTSIPQALTNDINDDDPMDIFTDLPWLNGTLTANKTLTVSGRSYEIESIKVIPPVDCPVTPLNNNKTGDCVLLMECPGVFAFLPTFKDYQKYFCSLDNNKYAGVCCPKLVLS
ncbi:inter-alpha-trypsin inhibitor heavy chain H4-like [Diabrotica virgifera virgifera]|uniref:Inter-alpha-trypsin inhibitor heavy chain H4-like n=1 Tax=Diabrotica virgifera virgifera TaxID=50390 RepID=A0A6P7GME0_DIAVI|nr:inter-alpha-trypsin inhibitor heavy chain H4-like [Diabrotica virgifera virgifera]XP_050502745.1 inter-alpha-trypsin inhibitor heavy chain H4-like [Diabrotica virgifera virgifera]